MGGARFGGGWGMSADGARCGRERVEEQAGGVIAGYMRKNTCRQMGE